MVNVRQGKDECKDNIPVDKYQTPRHMREFR
jgi:hypothetical protein